MSKTLSAMLQTKGHMDAGAPAPAPRREAVPTDLDPAVTLGAHAALMRRFVVRAIEAPDLATKLELWACYRSARADALAVMDDAPGTPGTGASAPTLRSRAI